MDYLRLSTVDYLLFSCTIGVSCLVGVYFGFCHKQTTTSDYLLGGRKMKGFPVAMSLVASSISGVGLIAVPAEVYMYGFQIAVAVLSVILMALITNFVYLPVFYELHLSSMNQYLEIRFDKTIKTIASLLYVLSCLLLMPFTIYAPSLAFNQISGISVHVTASIMAIVCIFYTTIGGLKAVIWSDTIQLMLTLCTLSFVLVMGTISVGGVGEIWEKSKQGDRTEQFNMSFDPTIRNSFWTVFIGGTFNCLVVLSVNPSVVQRFVSIPKLNESKRALLLFSVFTATTRLIICFSGLIVYTKYFDCDPLSAGYTKKPDQILPYYVLDVASEIPGISGLFVAGLFSTALSTLSTHLNTIAGVVYVDFVKPWMSKNFSEKKASATIKMLTFFIGVCNIGFMFIMHKLGSLLVLFYCAIGITGGAILGVFTLGMLFPMANSKGALAGVISSLIFSSVIIITNQIYLWNGAIKFTPKPLHTYGCNTTHGGGNLTNILTSAFPTVEENLPPWLFRISYHYYIMVGTLVTVAIGLFISAVTKNEKDIKYDRKLFSPCLRRFLPNRPNEDQDLKLLNTNLLIRDSHM
ncbi:hypothetical protein FQA39_LY11575 [Lamprigera yunnana]|nr:hypothetical protein FQA39_LY11575 [Lamprigera yunnana]